MLKIVIISFIKEIRKAKNLIILTYLCAVIIYGMLPLMEYIKKYNYALNIGEGIIYVLCDDFSIFLCTIGVFILLSNTPFLDNESRYKLIRFSRSRWILTQVLKIFIMVIFYCGFYIFIGSAIGIIIGEKQFNTIWSNGMLNLMNDVGNEDTAAFFPYSQLKCLSIQQTLIEAIVLLILFLILFSLLIFAVSLFMGKTIAYFLVFSVHIVSYALEEWILPRKIINCVLLADVNLAYHTFSGNTSLNDIRTTYIVFTTLIMLIIAGIFLFAKRLDL